MISNVKKKEKMEQQLENYQKKESINFIQENEQELEIQKVEKLFKVKMRE